MKPRNQWLFEAPVILETDRPTNPELEMEWKTQVIPTVLQSKRFQGDPRLQAAANNNPPFRYGEQGSAVQKLQQASIDLGYSMPITIKKGTPDGIYGDETFKTVQQFQSKYKLKIDGIAGKETVSTLDQMFRWLPAMGEFRRLKEQNVRSGNQVEFFIDGPATFQAMVAAIQKASGPQDYIYLLGWSLTDCFPLIPRTPGSTIAELFKAASYRGVQIRAMLWDQQGTSVASSRQNTAEVKNINELSNGGAILDNNTLSPDGPAFGTHHQKVLVVKGNQELIGFCGGIDIYPDRVPNPEVTGCEGAWTKGAGAPFHDVHCQIRGPAARDLLLTFIQRWCAHPDHQSIDITKGALRGMSEPVVPSAIGNHFVRIARTLNLVTPNRCIKARSVRSTTLAAIQAARKFIYIEDQYLVSMEAATALRNALPNIEHLTIVIPHPNISTLPQRWARQKAFIDSLQHSSHGHKENLISR